MKKILLMATSVAMLCGLTASGQGYFQFSGSTRGVWDGFSQVNPSLKATMNLGFLWGSGAPLIANIAASTPTNTTSAAVFTPTQAWNSILSDPNFHLAIDNNTGSAVIQTNTANGAWSYKTTGGSTAIPITGTGAQAYQVYVIGWDKTYATPGAAQLAGAAVGWSSAFSYSGVDSITAPGSMPTAGLTPFGVPPVPEPATFALGGLGIAAMLIARRRK